MSIHVLYLSLSVWAAINVVLFFNGKEESFEHFARKNLAFRSFDYIWYTHHGAKPVDAFRTRNYLEPVACLVFAISFLFWGYKLHHRVRLRHSLFGSGDWFAR